jgi:hypothetical protein
MGSAAFFFSLEIASPSLPQPLVYVNPYRTAALAFISDGRRARDNRRRRPETN